MTSPVRRSVTIRKPEPVTAPLTSRDVTATSGVAANTYTHDFWPDPALRHPQRVGATEPEVGREPGEPGGGDDPLVAAEQGDAVGGDRARRNRLEGRGWAASSDVVVSP